MSATTSRIGAGIPKGRILSIDAAAARGLPGVLAVVTAENAGKLGKGSNNAAPLLGGPDVAHYHQAIGLVVAESFEQARAAAALVKVVYDRAEGAFDLASAKETAVTPKMNKPESLVGDSLIFFTFQIIGVEHRRAPTRQGPSGTA